MNVLIITQYPFPYGMAQTNRLIAMSSGLVCSGANVNILITKPTDLKDNVRNKEVEGFYKDVKFKYSGNSTIRKSGIAGKILAYFKGIYNAVKLIFRFNSKDKIDVIMMGYTNPILTSIFYLQSRLLRIKFVQERSEYPFLSFKSNIIGRLKLNVYLKLICPLFDGFIVITKALEEYFSPHLNKKCKVFRLPILVEPDRFEIKTDKKDEYVTYCGSMSGDKDGVPVLIDSFAKICHKHLSVKLKLIGDTNFPGFQKLKNKVQELGIEERIMFTGRVERDKLPYELVNSKILALARPQNIQAKGGFPTKLGEYLATGNPVVVTDVGELSDFLINGKNAFIAEPDNVDDFANKLDMALSDDQAGMEIGKEGKKLALEDFNYKHQGKKLLEYFNDL